jgi:Leucine-rich repeat (LRR) protein
VLSLPGVPYYTILELDGPASDMRLLQALRAANPQLKLADVVMGVDCADLGRVVGIKLWMRGGSQGGLTSLPAPLWGLTALRTLDLLGNKLTSLPAGIGNLTALEAGAYPRSQFSST